MLSHLNRLEDYRHSRLSFVVDCSQRLELSIAVAAELQAVGKSNVEAGPSTAAVAPNRKIIGAPALGNEASFATSDRRVCAYDRSSHCEDYDKIRFAHALSFSDAGHAIHSP